VLVSAVYLAVPQNVKVILAALDWRLILPLSATMKVSYWRFVPIPSGPIVALHIMRYRATMGYSQLSMENKTGHFISKVR
jgi:hypothetical protein